MAPTWLYKLWCGEFCAYIGITNDLGRRLKQHRREKEWFGCIDRVESVLMESWEAAATEERFLIVSWNPVYNLAGIGGL